jgi:hypothetical protein
MKNTKYEQRILIPLSLLNISETYSNQAVANKMSRGSAPRQSTAQ